MSSWSKLAFQGKAYGLKDLSKKRRKKSSKIERKLNKLRARSKKPSEGQLIQRDFEVMLNSEFVSEKAKIFLKSLRGSYSQFNRLTPKQFSAFKKIWWEMKRRGKVSGLTVRMNKVSGTQ